MVHGKAPTSPVLTAQRSRRNRIQIAGGFVAFLLMLVYVTYSTWHQYSRSPTNENLFIVAAVSFCYLVWLWLLAKFVVPKVEFFENHLVARSLWGFSRQRSYREISKLEVKHDHLFFTFNDRGKISLSREEIKLEDLVRWLAERGVLAARDFKWEPLGTSEDWGSKQEAVEAVTLQNKATPGPVLTVQASRSDRIKACLLWGLPLIISVYTLVGSAGRYLSNSKSIYLLGIFLALLVIPMWLSLLAWALIPKVDFFENHITIRSLWGRSRRRSYQEIIQLAVVHERLIITFKDHSSTSFDRSTIRTESFVRWLAERGVAAARNFKWERRIEESL